MRCRPLVKQQKEPWQLFLDFLRKEVEALIKEVNLPNDLWLLILNCPGQTVISGTVKGVEAGIEAAKLKGAKRAIPLKVHGAFHSGLMKLAEEKLSHQINRLDFAQSPIKMVMKCSWQLCRGK